MQDKLNFYETVAILAVGTAFLLGLGWVTGFYDDAKDFTEASVGSFAFFTVAAYVTGFLVQALGALYSNGYWLFWGGQPTDWVLNAKGRLLDEEREREILTRTGTQLGTTLARWRETVGIVTAEARKQTENRLERFLGNYGLARGIAASAFMLLAYTLQNSHWKLTTEVLAMATILVLATMRMHSAGKDYAKDVFRMYLRSQPPAKEL